MSDNVHEEDYKGCTIKIKNDECGESPREWDNITTMICFHKSYDLGDTHDYRHEDYNSWEAMAEQIKKDFGRCTIQPLYLYDHSGITISTGRFSCPWDSGQIGFIVISNETVKQNWGKVKNIRKKAIAVIESDVKTYDDYLRGNVYGYVIEDEHGDEIDSCYGFYGDYEGYAMEEAKGSIDRHVKDTLVKRFNKLKELIKNKVPLIYREGLLV